MMVMEGHKYQSGQGTSMIETEFKMNTLGISLLIRVWWSQSWEQDWLASAWPGGAWLSGAWLSWADWAAVFATPNYVFLKNSSLAKPSPLEDLSDLKVEYRLKFCEV